MKVAIIPGDPLDAYYKKGNGGKIESYYNPDNIFSPGYILTPFHTQRRHYTNLEVIELNSILKFKKWISNNNVNILRSYSGIYPSLIAALCRSENNNLKWIASLHDVREEWIDPCVAFADVVICTSTAVQEAAIKQGINKSKTTIVPNWYPKEIFNNHGNHPPPDIISELKQSKAFIILHVGRYSDEKNISRNLQALKYLSDDCHLISIGAGDKTSAIQHAIKLGVKDRFHALDSLEQLDLVKYYRSCDCFCTPSLTEGFGNIFIEAAACGCAIVAPRIEPVSNFFTDRSSALLCNPYSSTDIAQAISDIKNNPELLSHLQQTSPKAAACYTKEIVQKIEANVYVNTHQSYEQTSKNLTLIEQAKIYYKLHRKQLRWSLKQLFF